MEAADLIDRVYNDTGISFVTSSITHRQSYSVSMIDTIFTSGRQLSNHGVDKIHTNTFGFFQQEICGISGLDGSIS
ncbi:unnamed protein product [Rotaria sp. Silwood1]|nr:unnamed protein product [Rotaria sp. Silwood1]CAF1304127.1 unnamed protein product [Rotaria sp. Silwood1]CAF3499078.1 unnamed protein product [Rotaria sp. Silwood1]CAF3567310.1 unnamed protein product [Rotaria sp. Silwood1]CAF4709039.1 unnamed protein product [Rotaria sp. Silwood1]